MSDTPTGSVVISPDQVYSEVLAMKDDLTKLNGLMERHIVVQERHNEGIEVRLQNHGTRLGNHDNDISGLNSRVTIAELDIRQAKEDRDRRDAEEARRSSRKAPWWAIIAAIGTVVTATFLILNQYNALLQITERLP